MTQPERAKITREIYEANVAAFRADFANAIGDNQPFARHVAPSEFAGVFAISHDLLAKLNGQGRSLIFRITPEVRGVTVIIVTPSAKEVNLIRTMHDSKYRVELVTQWYERLGRASQIGNEKKAFIEVQRVMTEARTPLGLMIVEGVTIPGMFDLEYPSASASPVHLHLEQMRNMIENDALSTTKNIHEGLFEFLEEFWPIVQEVAPDQVRSQGLISPTELRAATSGGSIHSV